MRRLYKDLLSARRRWPALADFQHRRARLLPDESTAAILHLVRGAGSQPLHVYFNLTAQSQPLPQAPSASDGVLLFSSEAAVYGGRHRQDDCLVQLEPYECVALGPREWGRIGTY
jgi:hypothetical protein